MLKWATSVSTKLASSISDTFAPLFRTPLEQLQDAWRKVDQDASQLVTVPSGVSDEESDDPQRLIDSPIVEHLNQLVEALVREEDQQQQHDDDDDANDTADAKEGKTGPCFEYFLNERILDRLCAIGLADRPHGMRQLIAKTLDAVLLNTRHPILPSMSVHMAVRQVLSVCYQCEDHKRKGYKAAFLSLLCTIAKKIKADNSLAGIFFDVYPQPDFLLFTALCALMSESTDGARAYESLLWLVQVPNPSLSSFVLTHSPYLAKTVDSLVNLFRAMPPPTECPPIDELLAASQPYPTLDNFFRRWRYCDQIMRSTYTEVQTALASQVRARFLDEVIAPLLLDNRENVAMWTTNFLKHLALATEAPSLRQVIIEFLFGNETRPERPADANAEVAPANIDSQTAATAASHTTHIRNILLKRLDSLNDSLCTHTLDLLQTLIGLRDPAVVQNLVLRNLQTSVQRRPSPIPVDTEAASPTSVSSPTSPAPPAAGGLEILPISQKFMFAGFNDLPDFTTLSNFEDYLLDAQLEGQLWMQAWEDVLQHPVESLVDAECASSPSAPSPPAPFFEGLFLSTLCNKLETLYENSFATNLKLSGVIARLSYCPAPIMHEFIFNPRAAVARHTPLAPPAAAASESESEPRFLLDVLQSVWNKGIKRATRMPNFARRKEEARQRLNQLISQSNAPSQASGSVETMEGERFFRGLILLEELLKEMFAIAQTKARLYALQKIARLHAAVSQEGDSAQNTAQRETTPKRQTATPPATNKSPEAATNSSTPTARQPSNSTSPVVESTAEELP